mmetsp:Transcript_49430/g.106464  ORF Transcript_49430/g.106464 Transcript_49430/m.106464 type:complete len:725 (+) Transcript_49430:23-2197(+)
MATIRVQIAAAALFGLLTVVAPFAYAHYPPLPGEEGPDDGPGGDFGGPPPPKPPPPLGMPNVEDHVSKGLLGVPADSFEGGHSENRDEVARAQAEGAGVSPSNTDAVIDEARAFEHEHNLLSMLTPNSDEDSEVRKRLEKKNFDHQEKIQDMVDGPGMENMVSQQGRTPKNMGDTSATSPTLHGAHMHEDTSPLSPVPLWSSPDFKADLDALKYADGNYTQAIENIARSAREAVFTTGKVFLDLVRDLYTSDSPKGKGSLANRSGFISAMYWRDEGEFKMPTQGLSCANQLSFPENHISATEAETMCNEMGLPCSGYACNAVGDKFMCKLCSGVSRNMVHSFTEVENKPYFALKSPDQMEWDGIVRRARQWVEAFNTLQKETETLLAEERRALETKFQVMLERRASDVDYDASNVGWKVRLDSAWRQEQYEEANWYAELMKQQINRIDAFYNQVLNKITVDVNMVNDKEQSKWNTVNTMELWTHSTPHDCWMAIRGIVYDFTYLTNHHPNKHSFIKYCGREVSNIYEDLGHDSKVLSFLGKRTVGQYAHVDLADVDLNGTRGMPPPEAGNHSGHRRFGRRFGRRGRGRHGRGGNRTRRGDRSRGQRRSQDEATETVEEPDQDQDENQDDQSDDESLLDTQSIPTRAAWHDFAQDIKIQAARRSFGASLLAMEQTDLRSVRPHDPTDFEDEMLIAKLAGPSKREASIWPAAATPSQASRFIRREG